MKSKISELKQSARGSLPGYYGICIGTLLIYLLVILLATAPFAIWQTNNPSMANTIIYNIALIIISMIAMVFRTGIYRIHLSIARGASVSFMDLFWGFRNRPDRLLMAGLLMAILDNVFLLPGRIVINLVENEMTQSTALPVIGYLLLAVGGIVTLVISLMFAQVAFLLPDHPDWGTMASFRESYHMMKGQKWALFCMELSFIGWLLSGLVSFGIGYLWIIPYICQTNTVFYLDLLPGSSTRG